MDKDLLIAAVFEKTPIWDKRHKLHSNRNVVDKYWKEISVEMKEDGKYLEYLFTFIHFINVR